MMYELISPEYGLLPRISRAEYLGLSHEKQLRYRRVVEEEDSWNTPPREETSFMDLALQSISSEDSPVIDDTPTPDTDSFGGFDGGGFDGGGAGGEY